MSRANYRISYKIMSSTILPSRFLLIYEKGSLFSLFSKLKSLLVSLPFIESFNVAIGRDSVDFYV